MLIDKKDKHLIEHFGKKGLANLFGAVDNLKGIGKKIAKKQKRLKKKSVVRN